LARAAGAEIKRFVFLLLERREARPILTTLLVAVVLSFTILCSVALGITAAYASVLALLHAFVQNSSQSQPPRTVLVTSENRVGID
jgi:hypothetical protein